MPSDLAASAVFRAPREARAAISLQAPFCIPGITFLTAIPATPSTPHFTLPGFTAPPCGLFKAHFYHASLSRPMLLRSNASSVRCFARPMLRSFDSFVRPDPSPGPIHRMTRRMADSQEATQQNSTKWMFSVPRRWYYRGTLGSAPDHTANTEEDHSHA